METSTLLDAEFKTLVIRMLNELSKNFNIIKKGHGNHKKEMKDTLIKIKNLQGINSIVDEGENQISNLEYKKAIKHPIRMARRKK